MPSDLHAAARDAAAWARKAGGAGERHAKAIEAVVARKHYGALVALGGAALAGFGAALAPPWCWVVAVLGVTVAAAGAVADRAPGRRQ